MNWKQVALILGMALIGVIVPWFDVGLFFMGAAVGAFLSVLLSN